MFNEGDVVVRKKEYCDTYWKRLCKENKVQMDSEFIVKGEDRDTITIKFGPYDRLKAYKHKFELGDFSLENE